LKNDPGWLFNLKIFADSAQAKADPVCSYEQALHNAPPGAALTGSAEF
jgi:hypothetical protein